MPQGVTPIAQLAKVPSARVPAGSATVRSSGVPAAMGYAHEAGIPFELGIIRNHYVGRTFIEPTDQIRNLGVKLKHSANRAALEGKRVVLVDDSIVRGTTSRKIVEMVRGAGAKEVHMRVSSPPTTHSCHYGIDTPERAEAWAERLAPMLRLSLAAPEAHMIRHYPSRAASEARLQALRQRRIGETRA